MLVIWGSLNFKDVQSYLKEKAEKEETEHSLGETPPDGCRSRFLQPTKISLRRKMRPKVFSVKMSW